MVRPLLVVERISLSTCGKLVPANASISCEDMPIECEQWSSALMEPRLPAGVKMKQCASGMLIWASASRFYEHIPTLFAPLLSMLMAVFLRVLAMIKQYACGM